MMCVFKNIEKKIHINAEEPEETRHFMTSLLTDVKLAAKATGSHRSVENNLQRGARDSF